MQLICFKTGLVTILINSPLNMHTHRLSIYWRTLCFFCLLLTSLPILAQTDFFNRFGGGSQQQELLAAEEAFQVVESYVEGNELVVQWQSANDYYFYRKNFKVESLDASIRVGAAQLPQGKIEADPLFGDVEVYFDPVEMRVPLSAVEEKNSAIKGVYQFKAYAQGCNKPVGVCYPPQQYTLEVNIDGLSPVANQRANVAFSAPSVANDVQQPSNSSTLVNIVIAFGVGMLLVFTPCVLPMIPILSGLIVGQQNTSRAKAVWLSSAYILGTAMTYTAMGIAAGAAGVHLQAYFQHPAVIAVMVLVLGMLSASMFGLYELRMPARVQSVVTSKANSVSTGSFLMTVVVGLMSALIVSTCVSPLLILVLGAAMREGSPAIGGLMMFFMALGMGIPLVLFALGAQWLLPRAGVWMDRVKEFFGFAVIATAILVASSLKTVPSLLLWAIWLVFFGIWLWRSSKDFQLPIIRIMKALSIAALLWGGASGLGAFYGGDELLRPLERVVNAGKPQIELPFQTVTSAAQLNQALSEAKAAKQPVLIDYYADWCTYCVIMEKTTYRSVAVEKALQGWRLLKVDVTVPNDNTQSAKQLFKIIAPPATLFINSEGVELAELRRFGLIKTKAFIDMISSAQQVKTVYGVVNNESEGK